MSIIDKVVAKREAMKADKTGELARQNRDRAVRAMMAGIGEKNEWADYMRQFADPGDELRRLTVRDDASTDELKAKRAYIVGNAICGSGTPGNFHMGVNTIDEGINDCMDPARLPPHDPYPTNL